MTAASTSAEARLVERGIGVAGLPLNAPARSNVGARSLTC
jgi:NAD/NADP transhydrogenase alpha subunit